MRFYAVRVGKWVEIRKADTPPVKNVSKITKTFKVADDEMHWYNDAKRRWEIKTIFKDKHLTLKSVVYLGGVFMFSLPFERYSRTARSHREESPKVGGLVEVSKNFVEHYLRRSE